MAQYIESVPLSGIIRIRDMMYSVKDPFRLDQGDVSFDAPDTVKEAMRKAIDDNRSHYVQTTGLPRLQELVAEKLLLQKELKPATGESPPVEGVTPEQKGPTSDNPNFPGAPAGTEKP